MGKYERGILGSFKGRVGTVVGSTWKGLEIMKIKRRKSTGEPTQKQVEQQARFRFMIKFISPLSKLFDISFNPAGLPMTGPNNAFSYNYQSALQGTYPGYSLDYSKVLISKGELHTVPNPAAAAGSGGLVNFSWSDNSGVAQANASDKAILVVHCPELNRSVYTTNGALRTAGADSLNVSIFTGKTVETWLGFVSEDGTAVASSVYTGQLLVS